MNYIPDKTGNYMRLNAMNRPLWTGGPSRTYDTAAGRLEIQNEKSCQDSLRLPGSLVNTSELLNWNLYLLLSDSVSQIQQGRVMYQLRTQSHM